MEKSGDLLNLIWSAGEPGKFSVFIKRTILIVIFVLVVDLAFKELLESILKSIDSWLKIILLVVSFSVPLIINSYLFIVARFPFLQIRFSRKINIVFAFNLTSTDFENFLPRYNELIAQVENEIAEKNLKSEIKIIKAPSDVSFKNKTVAETKVLLGLKGSTLLVWGHVKTKKGTQKFSTSFTYEFGYRLQNKDRDTKAIEGYLNSALAGGLFSSIEADSDYFGEQMLPTLLFILGFSTFTLNLKERSIEFLQKFQEVYTNSGEYSKTEMRDAFNRCNEMLSVLYLRSIPYITVESNPEEYKTAKTLSSKILTLDTQNYFANLILAYIYDLENQEELSEAHNKLAAASPQNGFHNHMINKAYFSLKKGDYVRALNIYEEIPDVTNTEMLDVSSYLNRKFKETGDPAFVFADGYISYRWGDKQIGKTNFKRFKKIADPTKFELFLAKLKNKNL